MARRVSYFSIMVTKVIKKQINSIHYLRGMAALMVVLYHLKSNINNAYAQNDLGDLMFGGGAFGVDLFFIISGFIICYATERVERHMVFKYIIRRMFRIYPILIISILSIFILIDSNATTLSLLRSLIPLNADYSAGSPFFGYNILGPAWTLTYEIAFYAIFLMSFIISHRYRYIISVVAILFLVTGIQKWQSGAVTLLAYNNNSFMVGSVFHAPLTFLASPLFLDFIYGLIIYKIYTLIKHFNLSRKSCSYIRYVSIFVFCISALVILSCQVYGHGPLLWGAWSAVIVLSGLLIEIFGGIRESKMLNFLGNISYSLYLTHAIVIEAFSRYTDVFSLFNNQKGFSVVIYLVMVSLFIAYIAHACIEKPFIKIGRKINGWIDGF